MRQRSFVKLKSPIELDHFWKNAVAGLIVSPISPPYRLSPLFVPVVNIMAPVKALFDLNIGTTGKITCTEPSPEVYLLTFASPPDNRLTAPFCTALQLALDIIAHRYPKGVVITTSGIPKFYSNGLDYESAIKSKNFLPDVLYPLWKRLLT